MDDDQGVDIVPGELMFIVTFATVTDSVPQWQPSVVLSRTFRGTSKGRCVRIKTTTLEVRLMSGMFIDWWEI